jgi:hypothetical protein
MRASCVVPATPTIGRITASSVAGSMLDRASRDRETRSDVDFSLKDITESLLNDRSSLADPIIPDGVMDFSHLGDGLLAITRDGRALRSDVEYGVAEFFGRLLNGLLPPSPTTRDFERAILSLIILLGDVLNTVCTRYGDTSYEEILIDAANQDLLRARLTALSAVPIRIKPDGSVVPLFGLVDLFFGAHPITDKMRDGYVLRRWLPFVTTSEEDQEAEPIVEEAPDIKPPRKVNLSDLGDLVADANNGFEDYDKFYFDNQDRYHEE